MGGPEAHETVNVEPNSIELQASDITGTGLDGCIAGEQAEVVLTPRDALGNVNASLTSEDGALTVALVVESPDGTQATVPMGSDVSKAGRLKVRIHAKSVCRCKRSAVAAVKTTPFSCASACWHVS